MVTTALALINFRVATACVPRLSRFVRQLLERDLFEVKRRHGVLLKADALDSRVRQAFSEQGYPLADASHITAVAHNRWVITSGKQAFVLRLADDSLLVSIAQSALVSRAALYVSAVLDRCGSVYPRRLHDAVFMWAATFRKRCLDRPRTLMVNLGAGKWYEKGWKVLDYSGSWYRYPRWFVDFPFDLTSMQPLPFADNSIRLLYSEHVFEHLSDEICNQLCREIHRSLTPGGGVRLVLPDADLLHEKYRTSNESFFKPWMERYNTTLTGAFVTLFAYPRTPVDEDELKAKFQAMSAADFFNSYTRGLFYDYAKAGEHINWFNEAKLTAMLRASGFSTVHRTEPQQSRFPEIRGKNFDTRPSYSLHIDAVK
jgi:predicted SAM-dependent methyltransferase